MDTIGGIFRYLIVMFFIGFIVWQVCDGVYLLTQQNVVNQDIKEMGVDNYNTNHIQSFNIIGVGKTLFQVQYYRDNVLYDKLYVLKGKNIVNIVDYSELNKILNPVVEE